MCLSSADSSLSAGASERVTVKTSSWTIAEICSVSDQWATTADSTNCTTFAGWTALFTTISHQHGEWCYWLPTWLLSDVSTRARICPSTKADHLPVSTMVENECSIFPVPLWHGAYTQNVRGVAIKKPDCFYYSFPATSMTKRRVGHWPVDFPLPSHKSSFTRIS